MRCVRAFILSISFQDMVNNYLRVKIANLLKANEKAKVGNDES